MTASVRKVPHEETHAPQQLPALFDHLVGAQQARFRYREASALAALRLMTSSNLVGVSTGSSLGARTPENSVDQKQRTGNEASYLAARIIHEEGCTRPARRGRPWKLSSRCLRGARLVGLQTRLGGRHLDRRDQCRPDRWQFAGNTG